MASRYSNNPILQGKGKAPRDSPIVNRNLPLFKLTFEEALVILKLNLDFASSRLRLDSSLKNKLDPDDEDSFYNVITEVWPLYDHSDCRSESRTTMKAFLYDKIHCKKDPQYQIKARDSRFDHLLKIIADHMEYFTRKEIGIATADTYLVIDYAHKWYPKINDFLNEISNVLTHDALKRPKGPRQERNERRQNKQDSLPVPGRIFDGYALIDGSQWVPSRVLVPYRLRINEEKPIETTFAEDPLQDAIEDH